MRSSRAVRWVVAVALASFVSTSIALGVSTRVSDFQATPPAPTPPLSINAALAVVTSASLYFLKIPTIKGESLNPMHKDEIDLTSLAWGLTNTPTTATGATFLDVSLTKVLDRASPALFKAAAAGTNLGTTTITAQKNGSTPLLYLTLTLTNTKVKVFHESGSTTGGVGESLTLGFTSLKLSYTYQNSDGSIAPAVAACWNLSTHAGC